jgi:hypothetical protein
MRRGEVRILDDAALDSAAGEGSRAGSGRRGLLIAGGAVVAVAVAAGAFLALQGSAGSGGPPAAQSGTPLQGGSQNPVGPGAATPGVPSVTDSVSGGHAHFAWTYDSPATGDSFQWKVTSASAGLHSTTGKSATVPVSPGQSVCIEVRVVRADGLASGYSDPKCATG